MLSFLIINEIHALLGVYAPCGAAHVEKWILEPCAALSALARAIILEEFYAHAAIWAGDLVHVICLPIAAILTRTLWQV